MKKIITSREGRKINLERKSKIHVAFVDADGFITLVSWKEWKKANYPLATNEYMENCLFQALFKKVPFNKKVDYNMMIRSGKSLSFEDKIDFCLSHGAKLTKAGILQT